MTAGLADDLDTSQRRREADLAGIRVQAQEACYAKEPCPCMHNAVEPAAHTNNGWQDDTDLGDELLMRLHLAGRDLPLARQTISASVSRAASAEMSPPKLEGLPQPRATHDAEKGLAATRRWHTLTRAHGKSRSADHIGKSTRDEAAPSMNKSRVDGCFSANPRQPGQPTGPARPARRRGRRNVRTASTTPSRARAGARARARTRGRPSPLPQSPRPCASAAPGLPSGRPPSRRG